MGEKNDSRPAGTAVWYCPSAGGLRLYSLELVARLPADTNVIYVSTGDRPPAASGAHGAGVTWESLGAEIRPRESYRSRAHWAASRILFYLRRDGAFLGLLLRRRSELTAVHLQEGTLLLHLALALLPPGLVGRRIFTVHNVRQHDASSRWMNRLLDFIYPLVWRQFDVLVTHGSYTKAKVTERSGISASRVAVVAHPIPDRGIGNRLPPPAGRRELKQVLFFGSLRRNKGIELLIRAVARLPDFRLVIAGPATDPTLAAEVALLLKELPPSRWRWVNAFIPDEDVPQYFHDCSATVLPYRDFEAQSGVLNYAFATRTPCIVSDAGDMGEAVRRVGAGIILSSVTVEGIIGAIRALHEPARYQAHEEALARFSCEAYNQEASQATARLYRVDGLNAIIS